jgi:hypothetical protein
MPVLSDRITHSMILMQCVRAMAAKALKLKVSEALKSSHWTEWVKAMNVEVNSLLHVFHCLVLEKRLIITKTMIVSMQLNAL